MKLESLQINFFRNLQSIKLNPSPSVNLIYGKNGSGKSSLLEAIHFLGYGRSFRTSKAKTVIQQGQQAFTVFSSCNDVSGGNHKIGLTRNNDESFECSINGERSKRIADMVSLVPVQVFTPQSIEQLIGSPSARRRFIDWGLFHVEHSFDGLARSFNRLLKQRNAELKQIKSLKKTDNNIDYWTEQLAIAGDRIDQLRTQYINSFNDHFNSIAKHFLPEFSLEITYHSGWDRGSELIHNLHSRLEQDIRFGHTVLGPHKGDIKVKADGQSAIDLLSRGQLRMLVAAMHLAQTEFLNAQSHQKSIFLLDDIGAELDENHRKLFIEYLLKTDTQIFVTAITKEQFSSTENLDNKKVFHVEHGYVTEE